MQLNLSTLFSPTLPTALLRNKSTVKLFCLINIFFYIFRTRTLHEGIRKSNNLKQVLTQALKLFSKCKNKSTSCERRRESDIQTNVKHSTSGRMNECKSLAIQPRLVTRQLGNTFRTYLLAGKKFPASTFTKTSHGLLKGFGSHSRS